ncbi:MAG TPA: HNH endonuclease [Smithella sp.]|nr:HNH endonuclease [Smithella sp.]HPX29793.1 HNH endonuclease [Smithella sp.]
MSFQLEPFHRNISDDELIDDLIQVANKLNDYQLTKVKYDKNGKFHSATYIRRFGSWLAALEKARLTRTKNLGVSDDELLNDLIRVAKELKKEKVTIQEYNEKGIYHSSTLTHRFGSWFNVLDKAGLQRTRNLNISNDELFNNLVEVWTLLGHQPKYNDLTKEISKYSSGTYEKRFGGWRKALETFVKWANEGVYPEYEDPEENKNDENTDNNKLISQIVGVKKRRTKRYINWRLRALVLMRDGARCQLCGATPQHGVRLHVDHIIAWSSGGETILENLQVLCEPCNIGKSDIDFKKDG